MITDRLIECDMKNIMDMRAQYKDDFVSKHGVKLGFMSAFVKAAAHALKQNPVINASLVETIWTILTF